MFTQVKQKLGEIKDDEVSKEKKEPHFIQYVMDGIPPEIKVKFRCYTDSFPSFLFISWTYYRLHLTPLLDQLRRHLTLLHSQVHSL